jgi:SAM-dependent methyltransferase
MKNMNFLFNPNLSFSYGGIGRLSSNPFTAPLLETQFLDRRYQFNSAGYHYKEVSNNHDDRKCIFVPTVIKRLPNLENLFIHDLATGDASWAKLFADKGADCVAAIDESEYQLEIAKENIRVCKRKSRIVLMNEDLSRMRGILHADVAFAGFLLHYAKDKNMLEKLCRNIAKNLKPGSPFFALNSNPDNPLFNGEKYFCDISASGNLEEGSILTITDYDKKHILQPCKFQIFQWSKETYESALRKAGFDDIKWHDLVLSDDTSAYSPGYWDHYISNQPTQLIECRKVRS